MFEIAYLLVNDKYSPIKNSKHCAVLHPIAYILLHFKWPTNTFDKNTNESNCGHVKLKVNGSQRFCVHVMPTQF